MNMTEYLKEFLERNKKEILKSNATLNYVEASILYDHFKYLEAEAEELKYDIEYLEDSNCELKTQLKNDKKTIEDLKSENEELKCNNDYLKEQIRDIKQNLEDNYERIPVSRQYDVSDRDFIC